VTGQLELDRAELDRHRRHLRRVSRGVPGVIEVRHRHAVSPEDAFRMEPGYRNFQSIRRGETVASDVTGPVRAPEDGLMLLPLYQGKGNDGYFVARPVHRFWLRLSGLVRRLKLHWLLTLLPGVRRRKGHADQLIVNTRIARIYPLEVFHLFGFRKRRTDGETLMVSRRAYDHQGPERIRL
jgi:succinylglutamate desuccinylase